MDHDANKLKATTIVSVPMHKVRDSVNTQVSWNENPINTFVCISIKAVPLDASTIDTPEESPTASPLPSSRGSDPPNFSLAMDLVPSVMQLQSEQASVSSPHNTLRKEASGSVDQHSIASEDNNAPAPELIESLKPVLGDVTSYRPFETVRPPSVPPAGAPPPPPPARPPSSQGGAVPPPPPTPPMSLGDSPRPPPPSLAPPVPPPPPVNPINTTAVGPTLDTAAALARPPAPPMRHQKSRSSFIFVPSAAEDTQGIKMQIPTEGSDFLMKQTAAPPPPPTGPPVMEVSVSELPKNDERFAPVVPAPPAPPVLVDASEVEDVATNSTTVARLVALNAQHEATIASLNEKLQNTVTEHAAAVAALQGLLKDSLQENVRLQVTIDTTEAQKQELQKNLLSHSDDVEKMKAAYDLDRLKLTTEAEKQRAVLQSKLSALEEELSRKESTFAKQQMQCDMQSVQLKRLAAAGSNGGTSNNSSANNLIISPLAGNSNNIPFSSANDGNTPNSAQSRVRSTSPTDPALERVLSLSTAAVTPGDRIALRRGSLLLASHLASNNNNAVAMAAAAAASSDTVSGVPAPTTTAVSVATTPTSAAAAAAASATKSATTTPARSDDQQSKEVLESATKPSPLPISPGIAGTNPTLSGSFLLQLPVTSDNAPAPASPHDTTESVAASNAGEFITKVKTRALSQTVAQLGSAQFNLQSQLTSEIGSKTPQQRLRRVGSAENPTAAGTATSVAPSAIASALFPNMDAPAVSATAFTAIDAVQAPPLLLEEREESPPPIKQTPRSPSANSSIPFAPKDPALCASPIVGSLLSSFSSRKAHTRDRVRGLSAGDLTSAAGQAAALTIVTEQRNIRQSAYESDLLDTHIMPIQAPSGYNSSVTSTSALAGQLNNGYESGEDRSVSSILTRSPTNIAMPKRHSVRNNRTGIAEGQSSSSHFEEINPSIVSSIRDLNASFRFSPALIAAGGSSVGGSMGVGVNGFGTPRTNESSTPLDSEEPTPTQKRVLQRMHERRKSQNADVTSAAGSAISTSGAAAGGNSSGGGGAADTTGSVEAVPVKSKLPDLIEPELIARQNQPVNTVSSVGFAGSATSHPERKSSMLQARYGRARLSRTKSVWDEAASASAAEQFCSQREVSSGTASPNSLLSRVFEATTTTNNETGSSSSESKGNDAPSTTAAYSHPTVPRSHREGKTHYLAVQEEEEEERENIPTQYLRKTQRRPPTPVSAHHKHKASSRQKAHSVHSADLDELSSDSDTEGSTSHVTHVSGAGRNDAFLHFPLELTQRDYTRRVFDILGEGIRSCVCALFQDIDAHHVPIPAHSHHVGNHRHSTGGTTGHANHSYSHNISSQGSVHSNATNPHLDHQNAHNPSVIQSLECIGLLKLLADSHNNFQLRPYLCTSGSNVPSNDVYTELQLCVDVLIRLYQQDAASVHFIHRTETGQLNENKDLFAHAKNAINVLHEAAQRLARTNSSSPHSSRGSHHAHTHLRSAAVQGADANHTAQVEYNLLLLNDLHEQLLAHRVWKDERMSQRGWRYDDTSSARPAHIGDEDTDVIEAINSIDDIARHLTQGKLLSPAPVRPRRLSTLNNTFGGMAQDHSKTPDSSTYLKRLSSPGVGSQLSLDRSLLSVTPPLPYSQDDHITGTVLIQLFQRSEATVAHLLVGVLPSNIAVIELMVCFQEIHDLLKLYHEHHRKAGHRDEAVFLREFAETLEAQLNLDLSGIGAFRTSQQYTSITNGASNSAAGLTSPTAGATPSNKTPFSPTTPLPHSQTTFGFNSTSMDHLHAMQNFALDTVSSLSPEGPLLLTPGPTLVDSARKFSTKKGGAAVSSAMLDRIYVELDDMAQAIADKKNSAMGASGSGFGGGFGSSSKNNAVASTVANNLSSTSTEEENNTRQNTMLNKSIYNNSVFNMKSMLAGHKLNHSNSSGANNNNATLTSPPVNTSKRESWSFHTIPVDINSNISGNTAPVVRIQSRKQSGKYLLEHMQTLVHTADELLGQLEEQRSLLVAQRNREYADVDHELTHDRLRHFGTQEEQITSVIKELSTLSSTVKHKLAPLQLTQNEELNALLANRGHMSELANKLFSITLTTVHGGHREHVSVSVATLLIRSKSTALVQSVYSHWPELTITVAVVGTESGASGDSGGNNRQTMSSANASVMSHNDTMNASMTHTPRKSNADVGSPAVSADYKAPYSLDFSSPTRQLSPPSGRFYNAQASPRYNAASSLNQTANTSITMNSSLNNTPANPFASVEYVTQPTTELDVSTLDFTSTRSLRLLGFTLVQLRDSKCFDLRDLLGAGFPLNEVKNLKSTLYVNITAKDLRLAGYSAHECLNVGFDVASLRAGGFDDYSLVKSGLFTPSQLRAVGCDTQRIALMSLFE
eukprot:gene14339-16474_t